MSRSGWWLPDPRAKDSKKVCHYFENGQSLCKQWIDLPDFRLAGGKNSPAEKDDCPLCRAKIKLEKRK